MLSQIDETKGKRTMDMRHNEGIDPGDETVSVQYALLFRVLGLTCACGRSGCCSLVFWFDMQIKLGRNARFGAGYQSLKRDLIHK